MTALFSESGQALSQDIVNVSELAAESDFPDIDKEIEAREEIVSSAIGRMETRRLALATSYPFEMDDTGNLIAFAYERK